MGIVTADISVTLDGYGAGPNQRLDAPFGDLDEGRLHSWQFEHADENALERAGILGADAYIMGRNMFSSGRGEWDRTWKGWWGEEPPYHAPVFVLTHHEREPLPMKGGTTFNFVTDGIAPALDRARAAAGSGNVAIAGGATTINEYLAAGLVEVAAVGPSREPSHGTVRPGQRATSRAMGLAIGTPESTNATTSGPGHRRVPPRRRPTGR